MSSTQKRTIDAASVLCGASAAVCAVIAAIIAIWAFSGGYDATRIGLAQIQYDVVYDFRCLPIFNATESSKKERTNGMRQRCKKGVHHKKRSGMPLESQVMRRFVLSGIRAVQASFKSFSLLAYGSCPPYPAVGYIFQVA